MNKSELIENFLLKTSHTKERIFNLSVLFDCLEEAGFTIKGCFGYMRASCRKLGFVLQENGDEFLLKTTRKNQMIATLEKGCQTNAPEAKLFVSAMGEVMRDGELVDELCSFDAKKLAEDNNLDWKIVCQYRPEDAGIDPAAKRWFELIKKGWDERYQKFLSKKERIFVNKITAFQDLVGWYFDYCRFRVYGEINPKGEKIVLVTEFQEFLSEKKFWEEIDETAERLKAKVWVMREEEHMDITYQNYGKPDQKRLEGKDHGRMERQVEFSWRVEKLTSNKLEKLIISLTTGTELLWKRTGVGTGVGLV